MFFVTLGTLSIIFDNKIIKLKKDTLFLVPSGKKTVYLLENDGKSVSFMLIEIHPSVFDNCGDGLFCRPFKLIENNTVGSDFDGIKTLMNEISRCIENQLGRIHILSRIEYLISKLCIYCDEKYQNESKELPNVSLNIIEYINEHYRESISYEFLMKKFFVSKTAICIILKNYTQKTLKEYIDYLRMRDARTFLYGGDVDLGKIAELCGYKTYSTFYRTYKRMFKKSPSTLKDKSNPHWIFTK